MAALAHTPPNRPRANRRRAPRHQPRLRIALFADSALQPRWMVEAFMRIARSDFAEIVLVAVSQRRRRTLPWLWRAYRRADCWLFGNGADPSEPADLRAAIPHARHLTMPYPSSGHAAAWCKAVAAQPQLDVAFVMGDVDDAEFEHVARYGIWRYCFGKEHGTREELAGWREVSEGEPVTASGLRVHLWPGINRLLYQSNARTYPYSVQKNRANLFRKTALFAERELRMLRVLGGAQLKKHGAPLPPPVSRREEPPGTAEMLRGLARIGARMVRQGLRKLCCVDQWFIAYRFGADPPSSGDLSRFVRLQPPRDRRWADPFPIERVGRYYIFFEEVLFATGKGHIAMIEVASDGSHTEPLKVLERDYHLSYPFLIERGSDLFMVPDSGANRAVELYRCVRFPDVWQFEKVLLRDVACADATFHQADGRWWMFVNVGAEGTELYDELHLYYAEDLLGDWRPHRDNPVKSDVCGARPAGALYVRDGILHRPAKICAPRYGAGISVAQVLHLTPQSYREKELDRILPPKAQGFCGIRTMNRSGELSVVDGYVRRGRLW